MNHAVHDDTPRLNVLGHILYDMVDQQIDAVEVRRFLRDEFKIAEQIPSLPGYIQPNGFYTFKLGIEDDKLVRLHYWPEGLPEIEEQAGIHDHIFDFTSLMLGSKNVMVNTHYNVEPHAESPLALYQVNYINPKDSGIIKLGDHFHAITVARDIVPSGGYYVFPAGKFHSSKIENNREAFTLLSVKNNPAFLSPRFLASSDYTQDTRPYTRRDPSPEQRIHVTERLRAFLG